MQIIVPCGICPRVWWDRFCRVRAALRDAQRQVGLEVDVVLQPGPLQVLMPHPGASCPTSGLQELKVSLSPGLQEIWSPDTLPMI